MTIVVGSPSDVTWLSMVNRLQRLLREPQTASVSTNTYSTLLGEFINQAKREVEDAWDWHVLRQVLTITTSSGTADYAITGSNDRCRFFSSEKEMYDDTNDAILTPAPDWYIDRMTYLGTPQSSGPVYYRLRGKVSGELQVTFYPTPDNTLTIRVPMVVPQVDFTGDSTPELLVPQTPVILRAYVLALRERGEDGGDAIALAEQRANDAKFDAIGMDRETSPDETLATIL